MGAGRSLRDLCERYRVQSVHAASTARPPTTRMPTLALWSSAGAWVARCQDADARDEAQLDRERAAVRRQRRIALEQADWDTGEALRSWSASLLAEAPKFLRRSEQVVTTNGERVKVITLALAAGPGELARALKEASALQRLSVGEATEIHRMVETELERALDRLATTLDEATYAHVIAALASDAGAA